MLFKFKQFEVCQQQSAMKIGTDGVLLGAWTPLYDPQSVLDVGAGTGLLALMIAQRCGAPTIDAVEIEDAAYIECTENFENSPWGDRLFCYHASFQDFAREIDSPYDLIVSNPPFFNSQYQTTEKARNQARFADALPFDELLQGVSQLLSANGRFALILPYSETDNFVNLAASYLLFPEKVTYVQGHLSAPFKRSLLLLGRKQLPSYPTSTLVIEKARGEYTPEYQALTQDFYLKF